MNRGITVRHRFRRRELSLVGVLALVWSLMPLGHGPLHDVEAEAASTIPLYDTAWELPFYGTVAEADVYFAHLAEAGFAGAWLAYFNHLGGGLGGTNVNGDPVATGGFGQNFVLNTNYRDHMLDILDKADQHGVKVGLVAIWAQRYVNENALTTSNAYNLGVQLGEAFGGHRALAHWVMGGDNFSSVESPHIWANLVAGLRSTGATEPVGYHTPAWQGSSGHLRFVNEPWVDFIAPQTGHCQDATTTQSHLQAVVNVTSKPVFAGELRYEGIRPDWCNSSDGEAVPAWATEADANAALQAGVDAIVFGHNERRQWGRGFNGGSNGGGQAALDSLGSPGERLVCDLLGCQGDPDLVVPPVLASAVFAYQADGNGNPRTQIEMLWGTYSPPTGVQGSEVAVSANGGAWSTEVTTTWPASTSWRIWSVAGSLVTDSSSYRVRVRWTLDGGGTTAWSNILTVPGVTG